MKKERSKKNGLIKNTIKNRELVWMAMPAFLYVFLFAYVPMVGVILAFKRYNMGLGIFGSPWCGLDNFKFLLASGKLLELTWNTFYYNIIFLVTATIAEVIFAIFLSEVVMNNRLRKVLQTMSLMPHFISWVVVSIIFFNLFNYDYGILNSVIKALGGEPIQLYAMPDAWSVVLPLANIWKGIGYGSIVYLAAAKGIDPNLYEAASIDGASIWKRVRYITLPLLKPTIVTMTLLSLGRILRGSFEMFYQLTGNSPMLKTKTDILDTYIFRAVSNGTDYGMTSAASLYQSVVCFVTIVAVNKIVKWYEKDYALF